MSGVGLGPVTHLADICSDAATQRRSDAAKVATGKKKLEIEARGELCRQLLDAQAAGAHSSRRAHSSASSTATAQCPAINSAAKL